MNQDKAPKGKRLPLIVDKDELDTAVADGALDVKDWIGFINPDYGNENTSCNANDKVICTTVGRVIFNTIWPEELGFINFPV